MKKFLLFALLLLISSSTALAETISKADIPFRFQNTQITYDVNTDGSYVETQKWSTIVLKENALKSCKESSVTFSTRIAKGEILEAYTLKKSGQRIEVPKNSYQVTINDGYDKRSPLYSDQSTISVVFPDLAVGDTTVFSYRVTNKEGIFPGHFSAAHTFSRFTAYDDVTIKVTAPKTMKLRHASYFLSTPQKTQKGGKQILVWNYRNKTPDIWTAADIGISRAEEEPGLYVSTFDDYKQIAEAYGARATPKAVVTERIKALASQITAKMTSPESQTRALYNWVARNISFGGNYIGIGAIVPRDLDVVLDNKMGDCKDHATLLQALLAAKNISCDQALINTGNRYDFPSVPVVSAIDHAINYIPGMKLFLDSTAADIPFGMLPSYLAEKPVLLVSNYQEGQKTPSMARYGHEQVVRTKILVNPDGTATGTAQISLRGEPAVWARALMRNLSADQEEFVVMKIIEGQGYHGTGKMQKDDPAELLDVYNLGFTFKLEDLVNITDTTGMLVRPVVSSFFPIDAFVADAYEPAPKKAIPCSGGHSVEEYVYTFSDPIKIEGFPKDFEFSGTAFDFKSTYQKSGNVLTVKRELWDKTPSNICSVAFTENFRKSARTILRDLKSQVQISN
jgi:transglutaminase-like putative cysteine protease